MTHANLYAQLGNRTSVIVRDALTRRCGVCHAPKGRDCTNIVNGHPLQGRIVHFERLSV